ncbi:MAG: MFS transporter [Candidatus Eiseniibacteriota bacterium]
MSPLRAAWNDYRETVGLFSRPARLLLVTELLAWICHGVFAVAFNLYLLEAGFRESFVGQAVSLNGLGMALASLPAGWLADRWGRRRCLLLGAALDAVAQCARATFLAPEIILAGSCVAGVGQALLAIAAAPFMTEHSTPRERTHLFSTFFAATLIAGVIGSMLGGEIPAWLGRLSGPLHADGLHAFRGALWVGASLNAAACLPLLRLGGLAEPPIARAGIGVSAADRRRLIPIGLNAFLIGSGAGLVIPFMNLYFANRFSCSSSQIGVFFSLAAVFTAVASLLGPVLARRFGTLRTAIAAQVLSLPFLVTLGLEDRLPVAVGAFWIRATLMQAATPLVQTFVMEALPAALRARSTSLITLVWNCGWAFSATVSGNIIQRFGYHVPFYVTAVLYALAATIFYRAFRGTREGAPPREGLAAVGPGE